MGIHVRPGAAEAIVASPERFAIQVTDADDVAAALAALRLVRVELVGLSGQGRRPAGETGRDGESVGHADVSPAVYGPGGPLLLVQHLDADAAELDRIPELVAARLAEAGVETATVSVPEPGGPLDALDQAAGAVILRLFPASGPGGSVPPRWLDLAVDWLLADSADSPDTVATRILGIEHEVPARRVADLLHDCGLARTWCDFVAGDPTDRIRTASLTYGRLPHLAIGAGGPGVDRAGLVARFDLLRELGRELADEVAYACLDFEPDFGGLGAGLPMTGWRAHGGASPNRVAALALDIVAPDAYPWQVLAAGPWARLATSGEVPPAAVLAGGRREVAIGDPASWLPRSGARDEALSAAIAWLGPVLVDDDELDQLLAGPSTATDDDGADGADGDAGADPDLHAVVLRATPSPRRSTRLTALELAAWWAHEPHSDTPRSVSPVLARFVRIWAAGLDDAARQRLKPLAPRLVGTAEAGVDRGRRWAAIDWLVREEARQWLAAAGETDVAAELGQLGYLGDRGELGRAVDVLAGYLARSAPTAEARWDEPDDDGDDAIAWEAWESVREAAAWAAAAEAGTEGSAPEVAEAAALPVLEASRRLAPDGPTPGADGGDATGATDAIDAADRIADDAWQAALHAVATEAWEQAWRAADQIARARTGLTIRVEMGRVAKTGPRPERVDGPSDIDPADLETADRAALGALVDAVMDLADGMGAVAGGDVAGGDVADDGAPAAGHPWDLAAVAARRSPGGPAWAVVVDGSRAAVGPEVWAEAMATARATLDDRLPGGADAAARAVVVAVAGEAASRAARAIARRAVDAARAEGAGDDATAKAAADALGDVAAELVESAFAFLDPLLLPPN